MAYTLTQAEYRRLKTRLSRADNAFHKHDVRDASGSDPRRAAQRAALFAAAAKLYAEAYYGLAYFEEHGYPDAWHRWDMARYDAEQILRWKRHYDD